MWKIYKSWYLITKIPLGPFRRFMYFLCHHCRAAPCSIWSDCLLLHGGSSRASAPLLASYSGKECWGGGGWNFQDTGGCVHCHPSRCIGKNQTFYFKIGSPISTQVNTLFPNMMFPASSFKTWTRSLLPLFITIVSHFLEVIPHVYWDPQNPAGTVSSMYKLIIFLHFLL